MHAGLCITQPHQPRATELAVFRPLAALVFERKQANTVGLAIEGPVRAAGAPGAAFRMSGITAAPGGDGRLDDQDRRRIRGAGGQPAARVDADGSADSLAKLPRRMRQEMPNKRIESVRAAHTAHLRR